MASNVLIAPPYARCYNRTDLLQRSWIIRFCSANNPQYTAITTLPPQIVNIKLGYPNAFVKKQRDRKPQRSQH